jgi:hypothetical protein
MSSGTLGMIRRPVTLHVRARLTAELEEDLRNG